MLAITLYKRYRKGREDWKDRKGVEIVGEENNTGRSKTEMKNMW